MASEFLNGSRWRSSHREMRTERVPKNVHAVFDVRSACDTTHYSLNDLLRQRIVVHIAQDTFAAQVPDRTGNRFNESRRLLFSEPHSTSSKCCSRFWRTVNERCS